MKPIRINNRPIGPGHPVYVIAEISANHNHSYEKAERLVRLAKECGADAVKLQTYTADTMTIDCDNDYFCIKQGPWAGQTLYELYKKAYTPWEWQPRLKKVADDIGITLFSTPFDKTAVDFLEQMNVPAYKIASFENADIPLIRYVASKGKPVIISTGLATEAEIVEALTTIRKEGNDQVILLKCTSAYPATPASMNIRCIRTLAERFNALAGLSDHSLDPMVTVTAVACGAMVIEKHFTESRNDGGPDAAFSLEPQELSTMIEEIRKCEAILGHSEIRPDPLESENLQFKRSLFAVKDIAKGEEISEHNVRSIRPGQGMPPREYDAILGKKTTVAVRRGEPLDKRHICQ